MQRRTGVLALHGLPKLVRIVVLFEQTRPGRKVTDALINMLTRLTKLTRQRFLPQNRKTFTEIAPTGGCQPCQLCQRCQQCQHVSVLARPQRSLEHVLARTLDGNEAAFVPVGLSDGESRYCMRRPTRWSIEL